LGGRLKMTASKFIGKIKTICNDNGNSYAFIKPNYPIDNHDGDVSFAPSDLDDISFAELSKGDFVKFETTTITRANGTPLIVAQNVGYETISGTINFVRNNPQKQKFWGRIKPDTDNFLKITGDLIFFSDDFLETVDFSQISLNTKVTFIVQDFPQATAPNINKKAKLIKIIKRNEEKIVTSKTVESIILNTNKTEENLSVFNTEILKTNLLNLLRKSETVRDHAEFEDLVFVILRLLGIHKLYQYKRTNAAGRADGFFITGNLSVIYDCTLKQDFSDYKADQIKNYINQINKDIFTVIKSNNIEYAIKISEFRQVWIITNEVNTKRKSRALKNFNSIWIKEVSIQSLIRLFSKRLNASTFEEETLADALRMIERIDQVKSR
jgi:hypothetical protein